MTYRYLTVAGALALVTGLATVSAVPAQAARADEPLVAGFDQTGRGTPWSLLETVEFDFDVFHPQAMEVTEDRIYLSSVEILVPTARYPEPVDGYDRTPGVGKGHLFVMDREGNLLRDIEITDGHRYHPGGIDLRGETLYLPVAEYRPNSSANVYKVDVNTFEVTKMFSVSDHLGGVVYDEGVNRIVGQSWGSRRFYEWTVTGRQKDFWLNPDTWIDYQDCEYVDYRKTLCSGIAGGDGGFTMVDLKSRAPRHLTPVTLTSDNGKLMTSNPTDLDAEVTPTGTRLTMYAAPDDGLAGEMYVYTADVVG
jgi:hypothetical protein